MLKYTVQRILLMLMTLFIITCLCFVLIRMLPPVELPPEDPHTAVVLARREAAGYNKPYLVQLGIFLRDVLLRWDWGVSEKLYFGQDVAELFASKLPATVLVNVYSVLVSIPVGIFLGIVAAVNKNNWLDHTVSTLTMVVISVPSFVYAFLIQYYLSYKWGWFPFLMATGQDYFSFPMFVSMIPPVLALSFGQIAGYTRVTRAELTEVLTGEYMLLARAKGLSRGRATVVHGLKNCLAVVIPSVLGSVVSVLSGSLIIERIFGIPGVGALYLNSINGRDYPPFMILNVFFTFVGLVAGIVVDISYGFLDPRVRIGVEK